MASRRTFIFSLVAAAVVGRLGRAWAKGEVPEGVHLAPPGLRINGKPAARGDRMEPGDRLTTDDSGEAVLVVGGTVVRMRRQSEVGFGIERGAVHALTVLSGGMLAVFGPGRKRIETPLMTAGIRGSAAYVESRPDETYICLCYGTADLGARGDPSVHETVMTTHHEMPRLFRRDGAGISLEPAPMLNHTDAELIALEGLVHRVPPFGRNPDNPY